MPITPESIRQAFQDLEDLNNFTEADGYCECLFVMIMRDENDIPHCSECKKVIKEEPFQ